MTLFEIDNRINEYIARHTDPETGELTDLSGIENLAMERDELIENTALSYKNAEAEVAAIKRQKDIFTHRLIVAQNNAERLKNALVWALGEGNNFSTAKVQVRWRKSTRLSIEPGAEIPGDYLKAVQPEVDKVALKKAVRDGEVKLTGVELVDINNIQIK